MATTYGKDYVDMDMDFDKHPAHGDLTQVKKSTAISRSLKNIIMTNPGERLFQPDVEGGLGPLMFEQFNDLTTSRIESKIRQAIGKFEPRANVQSINVIPNPRENAYLVNIVYIPDNDIRETTIEVYLERT
jgi:phage baseplate assembly protein W